MPGEVIAALIGAAVTWLVSHIDKGTERRESVSTAFSALSAAVSGIEKQLTLLREDMREDRNTAERTTKKIFERIDAVEERVVDRFSTIEQRVATLEERTRS